VLERNIEMCVRA